MAASFPIALTNCRSQIGAKYTSQSIAAKPPQQALLDEHTVHSAPPTSSTVGVVHDASLRTQTRGVQKVTSAITGKFPLMRV